HRDGHGPQDAIGYVGRTGNEQEVLASHWECPIDPSTVCKIYEISARVQGPCASRSSASRSSAKPRWRHSLHGVIPWRAFSVPLSGQEGGPTHYASLPSRLESRSISPAPCRPTTRAKFCGNSTWNWG